MKEEYKRRIIKEDPAHKLEIDYDERGIYLHYVNKLMNNPSSNQYVRMTWQDYDKIGEYRPREEK